MTWEKQPKPGEKFKAGHEDYAPPEALTTIGHRGRGPKATTSMDSYALGQMLYRQITAKDGKLAFPYLFGADISKMPESRELKIFQGGMAMMSLQKLAEAGENVQVLDTSAESINDRAYQLAKNSLQTPTTKPEEVFCSERKRSSSRQNRFHNCDR